MYRRCTTGLCNSWPYPFFLLYVADLVNLLVENCAWSSSSSLCRRHSDVRVHQRRPRALLIFVHYYYLLLTTVTFTNLSLHARYFVAAFNCIVDFAKGPLFTHGSSPLQRDGRKAIALAEGLHVRALKSVSSLDCQVSINLKCSLAPAYPFATHVT